MRRIAANIVCLGGGCTLRNGVLTVDERSGVVIDIASLDTYAVEPAHTLFYNGVLVSLPDGVQETDSFTLESLINNHALPLAVGAPCAMLYLAAIVQGGEPTKLERIAL